MPSFERKSSESNKVIDACDFPTVPNSLPICITSIKALNPFITNSLDEAVLSFELII